MLNLVSAPATEPVTLTEAKAHANVTTTDDDTLITSLIKASRQKCEQVTRRAIITQKWDLMLDSFPPCIKVPLGKLQSVTSVKYIDTDGTQQTLATSAYRIDTVSEPARITPAYGESWPSTRTITNAVEVRFTAGYGTASGVPDAIKTWIKLNVGNMYAFREQYQNGGTVEEIPFVDHILDDYRLITF